MIPSIINKYIFNSISKGLVISTSVFVALILLIGFIGKIYMVGREDFTISSAIIYTILTIPNEVYYAFPVSSVVGVVLGLGLLAENSELVVLQASGVSRLKIAKVAVISLIIWLIPISLIGEFIVPPLISFANNYKDTKLNKDIGLGTHSGVWIKEGNLVVNAKPTINASHLNSDETILTDIRIYEYNSDLDVSKIILAKTANYENKHWKLNGVKLIHLTNKGVETEYLISKLWKTKIKPIIFKITYTNPKNLSIREILKFKDFQNNENTIPLSYRIALWSKISYSLLVIATALTGIPWLFGSMRSSGIGKRLLIGVLLGIVLNLLHRTLLNVGEVFHIHPFFVTVFPSICIILTVVFYLRIKNN